jgi:hypothetical protein
MAEDRPAISRELEREVRKKCGYACVMCGCPIYDYDHIDDWADVKEHTLENLTLLCTLHHRLKNKGVLSREVVRRRTENIQHRPSGGLPDINFTTCQLVLGNNTISGWPTVGLLVYERDYFYIDYDESLNQVVIDAEFFDNNGGTLFRIENNIYTHTHSADLWDVETRGNSIIIREGFRKRLLIITIDGINNSITIQGKLFYSDDKYVELTKDGVRLGNDKGEFIIVSENTILGCDVGLIISDWREFRPHPCGVSIGERSRNIHFSKGWYVRTGYGISLDTQAW